MEPIKDGTVVEVSLSLNATEVDVLLALAGSMQVGAVKSRETALLFYDLTEKLKAAAKGFPAPTAEVKR